MYINNAQRSALYSNIFYSTYSYVKTRAMVPITGMCLNLNVISPMFIPFTFYYKSLF